LTIIIPIATGNLGAGVRVLYLFTYTATDRSPQVYGEYNVGDVKYYVCDAEFFSHMSPVCGVFVGRQKNM